MSTNDTTPATHTPKKETSGAEVCSCIMMVVGTLIVLAAFGLLLASANPQTKTVTESAKNRSICIAIVGFVLFYVAATCGKSAERLRRKVDNLESVLKSKESSLAWAYGEINRLKGDPTGTPDAAPAPPSPKEQLVRLIEERREKREAVLLSELEPHLKEARLEQIDEEYTPKIDALYATL